MVDIKKFTLCLFLAILLFNDDCQVDCTKLSNIIEDYKDYPESTAAFNKRTQKVRLSPDDLLDYLRYVNQFYAVRGRARYGKKRAIPDPVEIFDDTYDSISDDYFQN